MVGIDSFTDNYAPSEKRRNLAAAREWDAFEFHEADLASADLRPFVEGCEFAFHLAAEPGVRTSWEERFHSYVRNNLVATQRLLEACKDTPVSRVVYASSSSVYGHSERLPTPESTLPRPFSPYGVTKLAGEHLCDLYRGNYGLPTVAVRYFSVYGPRQRPDMAFHRFCRAAIEGQPMRIFGDGKQTRDFTFVADAVSATKSAARAPAAIGGLYNVGGGAQVSLERAIRVLEKLAGRPLAVELTESQPGEVRSTAADTTRARADLGYEPSVSLEDGLRLEFEWMQERLREGRT